MLGIRIICAGKLKEAFYKSACEEYCKRISPMARLELVEIAEEPERPGALDKEADVILRNIPSGAYCIAMCVEGKPLSSEQLADKIRGLQVKGVSRLCVIIGSSNGLAPRIKDYADFQLSISQMTFPHHLARVIVLEQIYRALSINSGSKYHK